MGRTTEKLTYTDGIYFCNVCDSPHEGEELAEACFDEHKSMADAVLSGKVVRAKACPSCGARWAYPTGDVLTCGDCYCEFGA